MAKAIEQRTTRRAVLTAAATLAITASTAGASAASNTDSAQGALPAEHVALTADIRRLHAEHTAAVTYEMDIECPRRDRLGWRRYQRAIRASESIYEQLQEIAEELLSKPVRSWADVAVRAELAKAFEPDIGKVENSQTGEIFYLSFGQQVVSAVLDGALHMVDSAPIRPTTYVTDIDEAVGLGLV